MSSTNENAAFHRLSAEGITLAQVKATVRHLQMQVAKDLNRKDRRFKADNPSLDGTCWSLGVEKACEKRLQDAHDLQGHYPGIRREAAEALGFRPGEWWDQVYNSATRLVTR